MVMDPLIRTVLQMMERFGGDAQLIAQGDPEYDPETSTVTSTDVSYPIRVMVFDYIQKIQGFGTGDNLIRTGDKQIFVKPAADVPAPKARVHSIVHQGNKYNVNVVKEMNPSGTNVLLYELFARE